MPDIQDHIGPLGNVHRMRDDDCAFAKRIALLDQKIHDLICCILIQVSPQVT